MMIDDLVLLWVGWQTKEGLQRNLCAWPEVRLGMGIGFGDGWLNSVLISPDFEGMRS